MLTKQRHLMMKDADRLILEGSSLKIVKERSKFRDKPPVDVPDRTEFVAWKTQVILFLGSLIATNPDNIIEQYIGVIKKTEKSISAQKTIIGILSGIKKSIEHGYLDKTFNKLESIVVSDIFDYGCILLNERNDFSHIPPTMLAGALLERFLKNMCQLQEPAIPIVKPDGKPLTLDPLISALATNTIDSAEAKLLRWCAEIRNFAAHGNFEKIRKEDAMKMMADVQSFIKRHQDMP